MLKMLYKNTAHTIFNLPTIWIHTTYLKAFSSVLVFSIRKLSQLSEKVR